MNYLKLIFVFGLLICLKTSAQNIDSLFQEMTLDSVIQSESLDLNLFESLKDSGQFVNNMKSGLWIEYSIDSSMLGEEINVNFGNKESKMIFGANFIKAKGHYINGKKSGLWTYSINWIDKPPFFWNVRESIEHENGIKNGWHIAYNTGDKKPSVKQHYTKGKHDSLTYIYNFNYPYQLETIFKVDSPKWSKEFYPNGNLKLYHRDTLVENVVLSFFELYSENNNLERTGFYLNETIPFHNWTDFYENGNVKYSYCYNENGKFDKKMEFYYSNGQLAFEKEYINGKVWNINKLYSPKGKALEKGTLKDGNGTLKTYNDKGNYDSTIYYVDGTKIKEE